MQSLRDKLLKSGLVDKKTARKSKTDQRRNKKKKGGARAAAQQEQDRADEFADKQASEARAAKEAAAKANAEREAREHTERLRNVIERNFLPKTDGEQRQLHFVGFDGKTIKRASTTFKIGQALVAGDLAIVAAPYDKRRSYRVVPAEIAERISELDARYILLWNKDGD